MRALRWHSIHPVAAHRWLIKWRNSGISLYSLRGRDQRSNISRLVVDARTEYVHINLPLSLNPVYVRDVKSD